MIDGNIKSSWCKLREKDDDEEPMHIDFEKKLVFSSFIL